MMHNQLVHDLADAKSTIYRELPLGSVWSGAWSGGDGTKIADVVSVRPSYTQFCVDIYECKVSRSDFLRDVRDEKYKFYLPHCHRFYYAVESGIAKKEDVPMEAGLLVRGEKGWATVKPARVREVDIPGATLLSMIFFRGRFVLNDRRRENIECWFNDTYRRNESLKKIGKRIGNALLFMEESIRCPKCKHAPWVYSMEDFAIRVCESFTRCKEIPRNAKDLFKPHYHLKCGSCEMTSVILFGKSK